MIPMDSAAEGEMLAWTCSGQSITFTASSADLISHVVLMVVYNCQNGCTWMSKTALHNCYLNSQKAAKFHGCIILSIEIKFPPDSSQGFVHSSLSLLLVREDKLLKYLPITFHILLSAGKVEFNREPEYPGWSTLLFPGLRDDGKELPACPQE